MTDIYRPWTIIGSTAIVYENIICILCCEILNPQKLLFGIIFRYARIYIYKYERTSKGFRILFPLSSLPTYGADSSNSCRYMHSIALPIIYNIMSLL